ncbi:MAG: hypothetical protein BMS9Abin11_0459 [Gammaproteobacteria bacterium]|nr:MAG: hypothetical protein BMS9Abin11_0459 [Gammaproteobacteria bacterium]
MTTGKDRTTFIEIDEKLIMPYGGKLAQSFYLLDQQEGFEDVLQLPRIDITIDELRIVRMIAHGVLSPVEGFMDWETYSAVIEDGVLPTGLPWGIPVCLPVHEAALSDITAGMDAGLYYQNQLHAIIEVQDVFPRGLSRETRALINRFSQRRVYSSRQNKKERTYLLAGPVFLVMNANPEGETANTVWPYEMRQYIRNQGWTSVTSIHDKQIWQDSSRDRLSDIIEWSDALLIHVPSADSIKSATSVAVDNLLVDHFVSQGSLMLTETTVTKSASQPRTLLHQAIISQNYGCDRVIFHKGDINTFAFDDNDTRPRIQVTILNPKKGGANKLSQGVYSSSKLVTSDNQTRNHIHPHVAEVSADMRRDIVGHRAAVLWMTGLSGAGKSTLAHRLERELLLSGHQVCVLDGDGLRSGLCGDLGFSRGSRRENLRRAAEVAKLMASNGMLVIASFISPFKKERQLVSEIVGNYYIEVYVEADLKTCESRDPKGLYKRARVGEIENFTGISSPYESPENPDIRIDTGTQTIDECVHHLLITMANASLLRHAKIKTLMATTYNTFNSWRKPQLR